MGGNILGLDSNFLALQRLYRLHWGNRSRAVTAEGVGGIAAEFAHAFADGAKDFGQLANAKEHDDDNHDQG